MNKELLVDHKLRREQAKGTRIWGLATYSSTASRLREFLSLLSYFDSETKSRAGQKVKKCDRIGSEDREDKCILFRLS